MNNTQRVIAVVIFGAALALFVNYVRAADMGGDVRSFYKSLKQPGSGNSCCDLSDCHKVDSDWRGEWWALSPTRGWVPIPDDRIIKNTPNIEEKAILCESPSGGLYCFLPQEFGT